jgi:hypothetical protein
LAGIRKLFGIASVRVGVDQLTVSPTSLGSERQLWLPVVEAIRREGIPDLRVLRSSHSVDVIPGVSSKMRVLEEVLRRTGPEILAIGDRGCWPGNDYEMLTTPFALSVDEVSPDPDAAWNLAPAGQRGVGALLHYLEAVRFEGRAFRIFSKDQW